MIARPNVPLIGRGADLGAVLGLLSDERRLVTITGPAGIGKSRLAREVAAELARARADELGAVWWCDLADAVDPIAMTDRVAVAIGRRSELASADPIDAVAQSLRASGPALLVLDNLDRLARSAPDVLERWLEIAPELQLLVSSRERLRSPSELIFELRAPDHAIELFSSAVRRARPDWEPNESERAYVAEIVSTLDANPLALELAAPRLAVMDARALLHRLKSRFELLRRGEGRHGSLEAALDASWLSLEPGEQAVLARASVFVGGFTLESAEAVIDPGAPSAAVLDAIQSLREKSLLAAEPIGGELRLALGASIREYASSKLSPVERATLEARHAEHYAANAEKWLGSGERERLLTERENLLAVARRVLALRPVTARAAGPALRVLLALEPLIGSGEPLDGTVALVSPVVEATAGSGADPRLIARSLVLRGLLLLRAGKLREGSEDLVRALALAETLDDDLTRAAALHALGRALGLRAEHAAAQAHFERARELYLRCGRESEAASVLASLAQAQAARGDRRAAAPLLERARAAHHELGDRLAEADDLRALIEILLDLGELQTADRELGACDTLCRSLEDRAGSALVLSLRGQLHQARGELEPARTAYAAAADALGRLGQCDREAAAIGFLGLLARRQGKLAEAHASLTQAARTQNARLANLFALHRAALDIDIGANDEARRALDELAARLAQDPELEAARQVELARLAGDPGSSIARARQLAAQSLGLRLSLAVSEAAIGRAPSKPPPDPAALVVARSGLWFRAPYAERVALDRRRPLALVLRRLAAERTEAPGRALGWDALLEAGWPGERVLAEAGAHRVRVAVSTLRKLGLREFLLTEPEGYLLRADLEIALVD